jgi:hypothetical protein
MGVGRRSHDFAEGSDIVLVDTTGHSMRAWTYRRREVNGEVPVDLWEDHQVDEW